MNKIFGLLMLVYTVFNVGSVTAVDSLEDQDMRRRGLEIMTKVLNREKGNVVLRKNVVTIIDKNGKTRKRVMEGVKKYYDDHSKSLIKFIYPNNIKGTSLLVYDFEDINKEDNQWVYLPSARKVRRIPANKSSEYFMGTDFTFEDMKEDLQLDKFNYKLLRTEENKSYKLFIIESVSKNKKIMKETGYSKTIGWIDEQSYMVVKNIYFDRKGKELKELTATVIKVDGIYTNKKIVMYNKIRKHKTIFEFDDIRFNKNINDNIFQKNRMKSF